MKKQALNLSEKVLAKQLFLHIDNNKKFTFAIAKNVDGKVELVTLSGEVVEKQDKSKFLPVIEHYTANSLDQKQLDYIFSEEERTKFPKSFANHQYGSWFNINRNIDHQVSPWTHQKLVNFTSTLFLDCNPDKKINLERLAKLEKKLTTYEKLLKMEQTRLNQRANDAEFVREYLQNLPKVNDPATAPNLPLQSEISQDDSQM